jgi:hypothetical protein
MDAESLEKGINELEILSNEEYGMSLHALAEQIDEKVMIERLARLGGIVLKQPFSNPVLLGKTSEYTGSKRAWELIQQKDAFEDESRVNTWQYSVLEELRTNGDLVEELGWVPENTYAFAQNAHNERGFFGYLAISIKKYICGSKEIKDKIEQGVSSAKKSGLDIADPKVIIGGASVSLATYLVQVIPVLSMVGAPLLAAILLIIYSIGLDAFCSWIADKQNEMARIER